MTFIDSIETRGNIWNKMLLRFRWRKYLRTLSMQHCDIVFRQRFLEWPRKSSQIQIFLITAFQMIIFFQFISSSDCKESYFSIPCFQGAFRRVKRHADKFSCKFRVDIAGNEIIIPAFTFVSEVCQTVS